MSLIKHAEFKVVAACIHRAGQPLLRTASRHAFIYTPRPGYLYIRARMISSRTNENHDTFPAEEIKKSWRTFIGRPIFINHHNEDPSRARGVIIDAALHEDVNPDGTPDTWVEGLHEVDAIRFPRLAARVLAGEIDRTSMGTNVQYSECSYCSNRAETPLQYCAHISRMKGRRVPRKIASGKTENVLISEVCRGLNFFENSLLVEQPADPTAHAWVDQPMTATASRRVTAYGEVVAPPQVDTLRPSDCPVCGDTNTFDGDQCGNCGYVAPPEQLEDPDLDVAREARDDEPPPPPPEGDEASSLPAGPHTQPLSFAGHLRPGRRTGVDGTMSSTSRRRTPSPTGAARQKQIRQQPPAQPRVASTRPTVDQLTAVVAAQGKAILAMRDVMAFVATAAGLERHPRVAAVMRTASEPEDEYEAGKAEGEADVEGGSDLGTAEATARYASWSPRRQVGWADGYQAKAAQLGAAEVSRRVASRRRTAADEDKDPVAMTSEEARQPAATDDPESIGAAPAAANTGVTPAAVTDPVSTDVAIPQQPFNKLVDPTQMAGPDSPPSVADSHVEHDIISERPSTDVPFKETGWTSTSSARPFRAIELARLRIASGKVASDVYDLSLGQQIASDPALTDEAIGIETEALQRALAQPARTAARTAAPARRGVVPQAATRSNPSLAPSASGTARTAAGNPGFQAGAQFFDLP